MTDFDTHIRLADLRTRVSAGEAISPHEMREVLLLLRAGRETASITRKREARKRTATSRPPPDLTDLFGSVS